MQTKTVKNLALAFAVAAGASLATAFAAAGAGLARDIVHKSSGPFMAAAFWGWGNALACLVPALGLAIWGDQKARMDQQAPKVT